MNPFELTGKVADLQLVRHLAVEFGSSNICITPLRRIGEARDIAGATARLFAKPSWPIRL